MVKDHSDSERGNPLPQHGLLFSINSKGSFISHRQDNTYHGLCYTSHGALAGTRNSSMGPHTHTHTHIYIYIYNLFLSFIFYYYFFNIHVHAIWCVCTCLNACSDWFFFNSLTYINIFHTIKFIERSVPVWSTYNNKIVRCSSVVRAFAHGAMGHQIDSSWAGPIELFLVPASAPWLV